MKYGIDLGTTYSAVAYVDKSGDVNIINNLEGENITPSVVKVDGKKHIVGREAKNGAVVFPSKTIEMVKRSMGELRKGGFPVKVRLDEKDFTPQEISALILKKLVNDANKQMRADVRDVVITVPAYFGEEARKATAEAAELAGLNLLKLIDEPTAAAICYQRIGNDGKDKDILVYDLGGGTFDISLVEIRKSGITVKYHDGNKRLGGKDWDNCIVKYVIGQAAEKTGKSRDEIYSDPEIYQDTVTAAEEKIKKVLTNDDKASYVMRGLGIEVSVTKDTFEELTRPLLMQTVTIIDRMISEKSVDFDEILLVGGSTRMPQVRKALEKYKKPMRSYREDEAVACGAAIYATPPEKTVYAIIASKSYGEILLTREAADKVEADEDYEPKDSECLVRNVIMIYSKLPIDIEVEAKTVRDGQTGCRVQIVENTSELEEIGYDKVTRDKYNVKVIGEGVLRFPTPMPKHSVVKSRFRMDNATGLFVTGTDPKSGSKINIPIKLGSAMSDKEKDDFAKKFDF